MNPTNSIVKKSIQTNKQADHVMGYIKIRTTK